MDELGIGLFIVVIFFVVMVVVAVNFFENGRNSILDEMNQYGNARIGEKVYTIEEVINNDK